MAAEAIQKIKDAEDKAKALIADSTDKAKQLNKSALKEGNDKRQAIITEAKRQREEILKRAQIEAEEECVPLIRDGNAEIERIKNPNEAKFNEAVNKVIERIVSPVDR